MINEELYLENLKKIRKEQRLEYFRKRYQKNKETILKGRKLRYHNDPEYRNKRILYNRCYYKLNKQISFSVPIEFAQEIKLMVKNKIEELKNNKN